MAQKFSLPLADQVGYAVASIFIVLGLALSFIEDKHTVEEFHQQYDDAPVNEDSHVDVDTVVAAGHFESPFLYRMRI